MFAQIIHIHEEIHYNLHNTAKRDLLIQDQRWLATETE